MIPDGNTLRMISGTSKLFTKYGSLRPVFITKMLQTKNKNNMESPLKHIIFHVSTFRNSNISRTVDTTGHQQCGFVFFLVGPKQFASSSVCKEFYDGGILTNLWDPQIFKTLVKPIKSNLFLKRYWPFSHIFASAWNLSLLGRSNLWMFGISK